MVYSREIYFDQGCPSVDEIVDRVSQRMGIQPTYLPEKWLLINPLNLKDLLRLYQEGNQYIVLTNDGPTTSLLMATLCTLVEMGGYYTD